MGINFPSLKKDKCCTVLKTNLTDTIFHAFVSTMKKAKISMFTVLKSEIYPNPKTY